MATSSSNQLVEEINDQFLICKICYDVYKRPKTLSCLHTFCTECLEKHQEAELERSYRYLLYSRALTCPICRKKTEMPPGGIRRLPDSFLVANLADIINRRNQTNMIQVCEICRPVDTGPSPAVSKCLDCCKFLCRPCVELHKQTKVTQAHGLFDIEVEKDIVCKQHEDEVVRFYCEPCEVCVCVVCTFQEHKGHEVSSFNEGIEKYRHSLDMLLVKCRDRIQQLKDQLQLITKCESNMKHTEDDIMEMARESISAIRKREYEMVRDLYLAYGEESIDFIKEKEFIQESIDSLLSTCNLTDIILKDESIELLLLKKEIQEKLNLLLQRKWICPPDIVTEQVQFVHGQPELGYLQIGDSLKIPKNETNFDNKEGSRVTSLSVDTQTDVTSTQEMSISMTIVSSHEQHTQTDLVSRMEIGTITTESLDKPSMQTKCTLAVPEVRDSQTMTINTPTMKRKTQTETVSRMDQQTSTSKHQMSMASVSINTQTMRTKEMGTMTKIRKYNNQMTSTEQLIMTKDHNTLTDAISTRSSSTETTQMNTHNKGTITIKPPSSDKKTSTPRKIFNTQKTNTSVIQTLDMGITAKIPGRDIGVTTRNIATLSTATGDNNVMTSDIGIETPSKHVLTPTDEKQTSCNIQGTEQHTMTETTEVNDQTTFTNYFNMADANTETDKKQYESTSSSTTMIKLAEVQTNTSAVQVEDKSIHVNTIEEVEKVDTLNSICQTMISIIDAVLWPSMMPVNEATNTESPDYMEQGTSTCQTSYSDTGSNTITLDRANVGVGDDTCLVLDIGCNTTQIIGTARDMCVGTETVSTHHQSNGTERLHTIEVGTETEKRHTKNSSHDVFRGNLKDVDTNTDLDVVVRPSIAVRDVSTATHGVEQVNVGTNVLVSTEESFTETPQIVCNSCSTSTDFVQFNDANTTMGSNVDVVNRHVNTALIQLTDTGCGTPSVRVVDAMIHTEPPSLHSQSTITDMHPMVPKSTETMAILTSEIGLITQVDVTTTGVDAIRMDVCHQETYMEPINHTTIGIGTNNVHSCSKSVCTEPLKTNESGTHMDIESAEKATDMIQPVSVTTGTATQLIITADKTLATDHVELLDGSTNTKTSALSTTETTMFSTVMTYDGYTNTDSVATVDCSNDPLIVATEIRSTNTPHVSHKNVHVSTQDVVTLSVGTTTHHGVIYSDRNTSTENVTTCEQTTATPEVHHRDQASSIMPEYRSVGLLKRPHTITRGSGTVTHKLCNTSTSPDQPFIADQGTMTGFATKNKSISCKPFNLVNQYTSTPRVEQAETYTEMQPIIITHQGCSPDRQFTADRGCSPIMLQEFCERECSPVKWPSANQGTTVKPHTTESHTSTMHIDLKCQETGMTQVEFTDRSCSPINLLPDVTTVNRSTSMSQTMMTDKVSVAEPEAVSIGTNTAHPSYNDRASTPVRLLTTEHGINAVVAMETKEASTPHVTTMEKGTLIKQPRTRQHGTSMPHVSFVEKETLTTQVHTMHKNISTENMNMVDKQTSTMVDITAAYRDIVAAPKPISVSRGTSMMPAVPCTDQTSPPLHLTSVERASSPVKIIMIDKGVSARKGEIMEPVDKYQAAGEAPKSKRKARSRPRLASIDEDSTESSMESLDEEPPFSMSSLLFPPLNPNSSRSPRLNFTHKDRFVPTTPRMGKGVVRALKAGRRTLHSSVGCMAEIGTNTGRVHMETRGTSTGVWVFSDKSVSTETLPVESKMAECISKLKTVRNRLEQKTLTPQENIGSLNADQSVTNRVRESDADIHNNPSLVSSMRSKSVGNNINDNELMPVTNRYTHSPSSSPDGGSPAGDGCDKSSFSRQKARKQRLDINQLLRSSSLPERSNPPPPPIPLPKPNIQTIHPHIIPKLNVEYINDKSKTLSSRSTASTPTKNQTAVLSQTKHRVSAPSPTRNKNGVQTATRNISDVQSHVRNKSGVQIPPRNRTDVQSPTRNREAVKSPTTKRIAVQSPTRNRGSVLSSPTLPPRRRSNLVTDDKKSSLHSSTPVGKGPDHKRLPSSVPHAL